MPKTPSPIVLLPSQKEAKAPPETAFSKFVDSCLQANEDGDAALLRHLTQNCWTYDHTGRQWYKWTGHFWEEDECGEVFTVFDGIIDLYAHEADRAAWLATKAEKEGRHDAAKKCEKNRAEYLKRIRVLQAKPRKQNVLFLAAQGHGVTSANWDQGPWNFACQNGVIDLRTGELHPGRPDEYIRTVSPATWEDITTTAPTWDSFLFQIFAENQELVFYVQRLFGYAMTATAQEHILPILWGQGRNGKSTLVEAIGTIFGNYGYKARAETLLAAKQTPTKGSADADTLALMGRRLVWASETNEGRRFNSGFAKEVTGNDTLTARGNYDKKPTSFRPTHTLFLLTNNKPHAPASDFAFWERVHLIPFAISFVDRQPAAPNERRADKRLPERLKEEAPGILAWLVRGCLAWQQQGLNPPAVVKAATDDYRREEDHIAMFIDDRCQTGTNLQIKASSLLHAYQQWCTENGETSISGKAFGTEMKKRFDSRKISSMYYIGVDLIENP